MPNSYWFFHRRKELKLNQGDLADRLTKAGYNVTQGTVSGWEIGKYNPPWHDPDFRKAFADALELDVTEMLKLAGFEIGNTVPLGFPTAFAGFLQHMSPEKQEIAQSLMLLLLSTNPDSPIYKAIKALRNAIVHMSTNDVVLIQEIERIRALVEKEPSNNK